jgi:hypothetical protein
MNFFIQNYFGAALTIYFFLIFDSMIMKKDFQSKYYQMTEIQLNFKLTQICLKNHFNFLIFNEINLRLIYEFI